MQILSAKFNCLGQIPYLNAGKRANDFFVDQLPVLHGFCDRLPDDLDAILVTADLQGREQSPQHPTEPLRLLGECLPEMVLPYCSQLGIKSLANVGAILAGDFYTYPNLHGRGGTGDVSQVWQTFADHFRWVVGVGGNHDTFETGCPPNKMGDEVHLLDGERVNVNGIQFAGLSGVIGNPRKPFRRTHDDFLESLKLVLSEPTDILVMHDGPGIQEPGYRGIPEASEIIKRHHPSLVVRGHRHWPTPLVQLDEQTQILNVEATVVILTVDK